MEKSEDGIESGKVILSTKTSRFVFLDFKTIVWIDIYFFDLLFCSKKKVASRCQLKSLKYQSRWIGWQKTLVDSISSSDFSIFRFYTGN